jgi:hypothetical protein
MNQDQRGHSQSGQRHMDHKGPAKMAPGAGCQGNMGDRMMGQGMGGQGMMGHQMGRHGMKNQGMMGQHMMRPDMGQQGMMKPGMGGRHGMMGGGQGFGSRVVPQTHLTIDDVRHHFEHRLEMRGNKRLKVGEVKEKDKDKIVADITTTDGSLVERFEVDRHSGKLRNIE